MIIWLVVWNMIFMIFHIGNVIIPTAELHHFSEGFAATTNQLLMGILWHKWGYDGDRMRRSSNYKGI
jgi:hypothetical protein